MTYNPPKNIYLNNAVESAEDYFNILNSNFLAIVLPVPLENETVFLKPLTPPCRSRGAPE
jgi:hypothetical protein